MIENQADPESSLTAEKDETILHDLIQTTRKISKSVYYNLTLSGNKEHDLILLLTNFKQIYFNTYI
jgi:hypothetical protein